MNKTPVDTVRISSRGKEILIQVKRKTGLEHWNEVSRIALCRSLANKAAPMLDQQSLDCGLEIDWRTFGGEYQDVLSALILLRAHQDGIDVDSREELTAYFRAHLERGIQSLQNIRGAIEIVSSFL